MNASCGTTSAATSPPSGTAVWRTPSAKPRSSAPNQCITARPLAEFTLAPAPPASASRTTSDSKLGRVRGADEEAGAAAEAEAEHDPLAEPIRRDPPRKQRHARPDPLGREQHADLGEREVVLLAKGRHEHRNPDPERGEARLRERPGGQHRPPVATRAATARRG